MKEPNKEIRIPADMATAIFFTVLSVIGLILLETQVKVSENEVVNGRMFPQLLMILVLICSGILIIQEIRKMRRGETRNYTVINLGTELRALVILGIMLGFYFIASLTGIFVLGALFAALGMLLFFKCKNPRYYIITLSITTIIWVVFRFVLNVRF